MFYLIGLGLDVKSISIEGWEICGKCEKLYLESYTIELPYKTKELEKFLGKKVIGLDREQVEGEKFIDEAKTKDIALLAYGSPLAATTHISLLLKCKKENIPFKIFHNASILDAVAETGLQLYKFGKTASMPKWRGSYRPMSFIEIIKEN
ncbi:MAG TPA: diphthine synthase, partial [Candidatus Nanoarchaeia archaeon]|nr:diphthine synthase [Candidatus Nanoarchaeia archaeon]